MIVVITDLTFFHQYINKKIGTGKTIILIFDAKNQTIEKKSGGENYRSANDTNRIIINNANVAGADAHLTRHQADSLEKAWSNGQQKE